MTAQTIERTATQRSIAQQFAGQATSDGAGVKLTRIIGTSQLDMLDPFLMLDCFESDDTKDYMGGFPTHPHRGFETVTYLLNGRMRHKDSVGNEGVIESGGVQWMSAGKGILHSEMPEQEEGLMKGFQLWVNLPASAKMSEPAYQEFDPEQMAVERLDDGSIVRVIAGTTDHGTVGAVVNDHTSPTYMDVTLRANTAFVQTVAVDHNAFVYVIEGSLEVNGAALAVKRLGVLSKGDQVSVLSGESGSRFLLVAGRPLNEPVARGGPFVMNTQEEVMQAFEDFRRGQF